MIPAAAFLFASPFIFAVDGRKLSGLVEDTAGRPLAGAAVWLSAGWRLDGTTPAVARGEADDQGKFMMVIPDGVPRPGPSVEMLSVWAFSPGVALARSHLTLSSESDREDIRLVAPRASNCRLTLLRPDGKPLHGATIKPSSMGPSNAKINRFYLGVPDALAEQLALRTDQEGNVDVPYLDETDAPIMTLATTDLGTQQIQLQPKRDRPYTLRPVGRVVGRVMADEPRLARGVVVHLGTQFEGGDASGRASTRTDDEGRFVVPALAEGSMHFMVPTNPGSPFRPVQGSPTQIKANQENVLEIRFKRAVRVSGTVRERGTNRPVSGAGVMIGSQYQMNVIYSNPDGRFEDYVLPGTIGTGTFPWMTPRPFFPVSRQPSTETVVPENVREFTLAPIELARGDTVTGKVIDAAGRPVPGARVEGTLLIQEGIEGDRVAATSGPEGVFQIESLDPMRVGLKLEASTAEARSEKPLDVSPALHAPVILTVHSGNLISLSGRVVNRSGQPVEGAELELWSQEQEYSDPARLSVTSLRTHSDGRYQTPRQFRVDYRYRVKTGGAGLSSDWSDWTRSRPGATVTFADLVIDRPKPIFGRVIDKSGQPVASADIRLVSDHSAPQRARSNELGSFRIDLPAGGMTTIFAEARGFRFHGQSVSPSADLIELALTRTSEPAEARRKPPARSIPLSEQRRMALKVLEPDITRARTGPVGVTEYHTLQLLARIEPARVLEIAEKAQFAEPMMREGVKAYAALSLLKETPDEAMALIESLEDPGGRTNGYRQASDRLPAHERDKKRALLSLGLVHAQGIKDPALRVLFQGQLATRLMDLGDTDRATKILRDGQSVAKELSTSALGGFGRGACAEELIRIDLPAGLALIQGLTDEQEFDRHHGNISQRLAPTHPAESERIWRMLKRPIMRDGYAIRVCYALAPHDLERARRIAGEIGDPYVKNYAMGQMALALSQSNKTAATRLVDEALTSLAAIADEKKETYVNAQCAASTAATLLEVVDRIDPERVSEILWSSLALRGPRREDEREEVGRLATDAVIAILMLPYDQSIAHDLLEPIIERLPRLIAGGVSYFPDPLFAAPAVIDPERAMALVEALPQEPNPVRRQGWTKQRHLVARVLASQGDDRRHVLQELTGFWRPDAFDLIDDD